MQRATTERERTRRPGLRAVVSLLVLAAAVGCRAPEPRLPAAVIIGATLPLTGADAPQALAMKRGYERAVAEANARGGVKIGPATVPVTLDLRDDASDAAAVEVQARALVGAGAHVILATPRDVRAVTEANVTDGAGVLLVGNAIDHPGLPGKRMRWMVLVRASSPDPQTRAHEVVTATLAAIARAGSLEPRAVKGALQAADAGS